MAGYRNWQVMLHVLRTVVLNVIITVSIISCMYCQCCEILPVSFCYECRTNMNVLLCLLCSLIVQMSSHACCPRRLQETKSARVNIVQLSLFYLIAHLIVAGHCKRSLENRKHMFWSLTAMMLPETLLAFISVEHKWRDKV